MTVRPSKVECGNEDKSWLVVLEGRCIDEVVMVGDTTSGGTADLVMDTGQ